MTLYVIIPILIFFARVVDMSLETLRVIFITKGYKYLAPAIGFFEILVWLFAIEQIITNVTNIVAYIAYGAGFATGTFLGIYVEEKISVGKVMITIIVTKNIRQMIKALKKAGFVMTMMNARGSTEKKNVKYIFTVVKRFNVKKVIKIVERYDYKAFYSVEAVHIAAERESSKYGPERHFANFLKFHKEI